VRRGNLAFAFALAVLTSATHAACRAITAPEGPAWYVDVGTSAGYESRGASACSACGGQWISRSAGGFYCRRTSSSSGLGMAAPSSGDPIRAAGEAGVAAGLAFHDWLEEQAARAKAQKAAEEARRQDDERRRREEEARKKEESWQRLSGTMRLESQDTLAMRTDSADDLPLRLGDQPGEIVAGGEELRDGPTDKKQPSPSARAAACGHLKGPESDGTNSYFWVVNTAPVPQYFTIKVGAIPHRTLDVVQAGQASDRIYVGPLTNNTSVQLICEPVQARKP
jgi:hypothetical protein